MEVKQLYELVNTATSEVLGDSIVVAEDLSNLVDVGTALENAQGLDNYVRSLNDHIGRVIFVNRVYSGRVPSVLKDGWEFGSILEKVQMDLPEATENESWELEDGQSYDPNVFYKPSVSVKFWNKRATIEIPISITEMQVKSAFSSAVQMNSFVSMIYTAIQNSMTLKLDTLIMRTINSFIGDTIYAEYAGANLNSKSGIRAVNLLYLYNNRAGHGDAISAGQAVHNPDFLRYAALMISLYADRMSSYSELFNIGGKPRFTPKDRMHIVLLSEFEKGANVYLQSNVFHNELTALPSAETVPFWQGSGTDYAFTSTGKIQVTTGNSHSVTATGILGCIFDGDALGVTNENPRVKTNYNAKAEFWNEYHKFDAGYFNDTDENFVVFFVA